MHMNGSCHTHMAVEIYLYVLQRMNCEWVMCVLLCVTSHIWMSHVTHTWQWRCMSHVCIICFMSHTYEWVMSHTHGNWNVSLSRMMNDEWDASHIWMCRVTRIILCHTHMNQSCHSHMAVEMHESRVCCFVVCHTYEWVVSHTRQLSHVTHTAIKMCHYRWIICVLLCFASHTWMCHVTHTAVEIHHHREGWISRVTHVNVSCHTHILRHTYEWVISHAHGSWNVSPSRRMNHKWVASHIWMCRVTHTWQLRYMSRTCVALFHVTHMNTSCHTHVSWETSPSRTAREERSGRSHSARPSPTTGQRLLVYIEI